MLTTLTKQHNGVATSKHGTGGVQHGRRRGLTVSKLNPEIGVLNRFSAKGAAVRFGQRRLDRGDPVWEVSGGQVATKSGFTSGARDGGCEVMTAVLSKWGVAVKRRGEVGTRCRLGFDRKREFGLALNGPLSHLFLNSTEQQHAPIRSGAVTLGRMNVLGRCGFGTASGSLHPPLRPQLWQSGTMTYNSSKKRPGGTGLFDVGAKRVANTGASSGQKSGRRLGARVDWQCLVGIKRGTDSTQTKRGLNGQDFVRQ